MGGMNTFNFRPHCGESGDDHHLATMFLLAKSINHGIRLDSQPVLKQLYYLTQTGISVSPKSNEHLFMDMDDSPFGRFFWMGLNVTLSTDDPLQFHESRYSSDALDEEYICATCEWNLSGTDNAEIMRNSVLQSGFTPAEKKRFLGENYDLGGVEGNDQSKTNVPKVRAKFREENLLSE